MIDDGKGVEVVKPSGADVLADPRWFRITKEDIEVIGYSDGCVGCSAMRIGKTVQRHSESRRRRVEEHLMGTDGGK